MVSGGAGAAAGAAGGPRRMAASLERMRAGLQRSEMDIEANGRNFHIVYLEGGPQGAPPLLLLHGIGADKDNWTRVAATLTQRYRVYAIDPIRRTVTGFVQVGQSPSGLAISRNGRSLLSADRCASCCCAARSPISSSATPPSASSARSCSASPTATRKCAISPT